MNLKGRILSVIDKDPIILSHHPLCGKFDDHVFRIRRRHVCIGCATVYPSAIVAALSLWIVNSSSFVFLFSAAVVSFSFNLMRFAIKSHRYSVLFNIFLGISLGASVLSAIYAPGDLQLAVVLIVLGTAASFSVVKGHRVMATCKSCERYREFPYCYNPSRLEIK